MTNKEDRIKMLIKLRKRGGWNGFWSIREETAEWGYDLALADMHGLFCQLSDEEKKLPVVQKLAGFFGWLEKPSENDASGQRLIVNLVTLINSNMNTKITEEDKLLMQQTTLEDGTNAWDHIQSWPKEDDRPWIVRGIKSCIAKGYHLNVMMIGWETRNIRAEESNNH